MQTANENLIGFLKENPNSTKETIGNGTGLKGLVLFNILRKLQNEEQITSQGDGDGTTYSLVEETESVEQTVEEDTSGIIIEEPVSTDQTEQSTEVEENEATDFASNEPDIEQPVVEKGKSTVRDNSKFTFNGEAYGKGPLVRAVVSQYVKDNPAVTYEKLKEAFPDTLLKRFGIFQDEKSARDIAKKGERYFFKEEHVIKLADARIVVCNQFTSDNIQPFLKVAEKLGYDIK